MTISDVRTNLKNAMLAKDAERVSVIRMLLSSINYAAMSKNKKADDTEMSEEEVNNVIMKEIKTRTEAIQQFEESSKLELAQKEKSELEILKEFAPKMMSEDETKREAEKILANVDTTKGIGPAIGAVMKELKGKADPAIVNKVINELLKK